MSNERHQEDAIIKLIAPQYVMMVNDRDSNKNTLDAIAYIVTIERIGDHISDVIGDDMSEMYDALLKKSDDTPLLNTFGSMNQLIAPMEDLVHDMMNSLDVDYIMNGVRNHIIKIKLMEADERMER